MRGGLTRRRELGTVLPVSDPTSLPSFGVLPAAVPGVAPVPGPGFPGDPAFAGQDGAVALRERVFAAQLDEGFRPAVDEDGDVAYRAQGQQLFVRCLDTSPPLVRVFGQWIEHDVPGGELTRLRAANAVVGAMNLVKATVVEDRLVVAVDLVVADGLDLRSLLAATSEALLQSVQAWYASVFEFAQVPGHS